MASEYSVNIKLNTQQVKKDLQTIKGEIGKVGQSKSKGAKKSLTDTEQQLRLENQSLRIQNQGYGLTLKSLPLAEKGVDLAKIAKNISEGIGDAKKFEFDQAKKSLLVADQQIKKQQILAKANEDVNKKVKPLNPLSSESPVQQALKGMDEKTKKDQKQAILNRRKSISLGKDLVKIKVNEGKATAKNIELEAKQLAKQTERLNAAISPKGDFSRLSDRQSRDVQGKRTFMNNPLARRGVPMPTKGFDFQSALISGGFPLLFGQGPVTAAAGALGGGVGGMFGQMGGFAGGIAATAAVQSLTNIMNGVRELGKSLTTLDGQFTLLSEKSLFSSKQTEARAKVLQALGEREKLATLLSEELTAVLGEGGAEKLRRAGEASKELDKTVAELTINLQLLLAGPLTKFLEMVNNTLDQGKSVSLGEGKGDVRFGGKEETFVEEFGEVLKLLSQGQLDRIFKAANDLQINPGDAAARAVLQSEGLNNLSNPELQALRKFSLVKQVNPESKLVGGEGPDKDDPANKIVEIDAQRVANANRKIQAMQKEMEFAQSILEVGYEEAELQREIQSIREGLNEEELKLLETGELTVEQLIKKNREAKNLVDNARLVSESFEQLKDTIVMDIGNGIKDLIKGTASLNDVLTGVLDKMTDAFLNLAIFGNFAGGSVTGGLLGMFKANGGPVKGGRSYIVGERGPEVFTPGVSGGITPNHALGGSTNVSVNVDASGSSVEGDAGQAEQLGEAISQAIQAELIQQKRPGGILYN